MLITKFNRMIRNRWVWTVIGGIVIVSFVGYFTPGSRSGASKGEIPSAGKIDGKSVPQTDLLDALRKVELGIELQYGHSAPAGFEAELRKEAWQRLVSLRKAREMGIVVSDAEVNSAIQRLPMFQAEGAFSPARYEAFKGVLENKQFTENQFEEYLREQIILKKMEDLVRPAVWVPPAEFQELLRKYTDVFTVDYLHLKPKDVTEKVSATAADAKAFYEANTNLFVVPEKVSVKYVAFPIALYASNADINASDITNYYEEHISDFTLPSTNEQPVAEDIDDVRDQIADTLIRSAALSRAIDQAAVFSDKLVPGRKGTPPTFEKVAADMHLAVSTTALFSATEKLTSLGVGPDFNHAAFALQADPEECFSDPVPGVDDVYVLAFNTREDSRLPAFDEVAAKAMTFATRKAENEAFVKKAKDVHAALEKALAGGKSFAEAAKAQGETVLKPEPFAATEPPPELDSQRVISGIVSLEKGELSEPLATTNGLILAYVADRTPGDQASIDAIKSQLNQNLNRRRGSAMFQEWQRYLLDQAKIEDPYAATNSERSAEETDE